MIDTTPYAMPPYDTPLCMPLRRAYLFLSPLRVAACCHAMLPTPLLR